MMRPYGEGSRRGGMVAEWVTSVIDELNGSPMAQALFMLLVVLGRFALDRWERKREMEQHKRRRMVRHG